MKELTFNEMESVSGGFNLVSAATGFASFVANSAAGFYLICADFRSGFRLFRWR